MFLVSFCLLKINSCLGKVLSFQITQFDGVFFQSKLFLVWFCLLKITPVYKKCYRFKLLKCPNLGLGHFSNLKGIISNHKILVCTRGFQIRWYWYSKRQGHVINRQVFTFALYIMRFWQLSVDMSFQNYISRKFIPRDWRMHRNRSINCTNWNFTRIMTTKKKS